MGVDEVLSGTGAPVAHDVLLQMLGLQGLAQQGVVQQIELAGGQIVGRPPPGIHRPELLLGERVLFRHAGRGLGRRL